MQFDSTIENAFVCSCGLSRTLAHAAVPRTIKDNVHLKYSISGTSLGLADDRQTVWLSQVPTPAKLTNTASSVEKLSPMADTGTSSVEPHRFQKKKERLAFTEDKPTLPELIAFKTQSGSIDITEEIGTYYYKLGPLLLKDENGAVTGAIIDEYHNAARINHEILKRWLGGTGLKPVQWSILISVLRNIKLSTLADRIADNLQ